MWIWDDAGRVGLPRIAVDAVGARWTESYGLSVNVTRLEGRVLVVRGSGPPHSVEDAEGRPRVLGAGPLALTCVEPFARWRLTFDGLAAETTTDEQIVNRDRGVSNVPPTGTGVPLHIDIDTHMAVAPWVPGIYSRMAISLPPSTASSRSSRLRVSWTSTAKRFPSGAAACASIGRETSPAATTPTG